MKVIWVTDAKYLKEYQIQLKFNDGQKGIVDLQNSLTKPIFQALQDREYFQKFCLNQWTINWPNGADFAPEFLHQLIQREVSHHA